MEIGRTEVIDNNLCPEWNKKFYIDYFFEAQQKLRFDVWVFFLSSSELKACVELQLLREMNGIFNSWF